MISQFTCIWFAPFLPETLTDIPRIHPGNQESRCCCRRGPALIIMAGVGGGGEGGLHSTPRPWAHLQPWGCPLILYNVGQITNGVWLGPLRCILYSNRYLGLRYDVLGPTGNTSVFKKLRCILYCRAIWAQDMMCLGPQEKLQFFFKLSVNQTVTEFCTKISIYYVSKCFVFWLICRRAFH
jgi:hypothetical protein